MNIFEAIILGLVQGLTEFLPVSSSGHLVLLQGIFGIEGDVVLFDIMLHFATLLAVGVFFFKDILNIFKPPYKTLFFLLLATIPAGVIMLLFKDSSDTLFIRYISMFLVFNHSFSAFFTEFIVKKNIINIPIIQ
jgi:undecaprenyl-diphosphatase